MTIAFTCPNCLTDLRLDDSHAGECVKCPRCHGLMVVPDVEDELAEDDHVAPAAPQKPATPEPPVDDWQRHLSSLRGATTGTPGRGLPQPETAPADRVKFFCSNCGAKMSAAVAAAGRQVTCPKCRSRERIPGGREVSCDTASARADETPAHALPAHFVGDPCAMRGNSDSLIDALDDVDLAEARAPVASPFLTGRAGVAPRHERPRHWVLSWSTVLVAAGTLFGLLLVWGAVSAPALYRDHVRPYFDKHIAGAFSGDPTRQLMRLAEEMLDVTDRLTQALRQVHDTDSARRVMPAYIEDLLRLGELEHSVTELRSKITHEPPKEEFDALSARMRQQQTQLKLESVRCGRIPGVSLIMANAISEAVSRDTTGKLAESLKKTPGGRAILALTGQSAEQKNGPGAPPASQTPPRPVAPAQQQSTAGVQRGLEIGHGTSSGPAAVPHAPPVHQPATPPSDANADATDGQVSQNSADARKHVALLNHLEMLQNTLLDGSREIVDAASLQKKALGWAGMARSWQVHEATIQNLAGQEFVGDDANRYLQAKETTDRQRSQLLAEFDRLEKQGFLPKLNAQLVRMGGKAVGSGSVAPDDENSVRKPSKRAAPRALKRVTSP